MRTLAALAALGAALLACGGADAQTYSRDFILYNQTASPITGMWTSVAASDTWYALRPFSTVGSGSNSRITFNNTGPCQVQLRVELGGSYYSWTKGFNLCAVRKITVFFDRDGDLEAESD